jgi:hypothetical protein
MGRRSGRRPRGSQEAGGPSLFFIIALTVGVILLLWGAWVVIRTPLSPVNKRGRAAIACSTSQA